MLFAIAFAAALWPVTAILTPNTCVTQAQLADVPPQGSTRDFQARATFFDRDFAFSDAYFGETNGQQELLKRKGGRWCVVPFSGMYFDEPALVRLGVPRPVARRFRVQAGNYLQALVPYRTRADKAVDRP
jgi:hypothetical protein